jgi:hypothetical protein
MSSETGLIKLLKQEDWPAWYDFVRSEAITAEIWDFVDPDKKDPPTRIKPSRAYYTKARPTPMNTPGNTGTIQQTQPDAVDPELEALLAGLDPAGKLNAYRIDLAQYEQEK